MSDDTEHRDDERFVRAFDAPSAPLGEIAKGKLESEGIPVLVKGGSSYAYPTGPVQLWVPEEHLERARAIIEDVGAGNLEFDENEDESEPEKR